MTNITKYLAAAAAIGGLAAPATAQYAPYPQGYPQPTYPQAYPQGYAQPYGYNQGYSTGNPVTDIIDQLLGNRYNVTDRQAVRQCANAARAQAAQQYGAYGNNGYAYGRNYGQNYNNAYAGNLRVSAITSVERRSNGLRVSGLMSSVTGYNGQNGYQYGYRNGYQNRAYAQGDVSFRCNVDYRGQVTGLRIGRNGYRG